MGLYMEGPIHRYLVLISKWWAYTRGGLYTGGGGLFWGLNGILDIKYAKYIWITTNPRQPWPNTNYVKSYSGSFRGWGGRLAHRNTRAMDVVWIRYYQAEFEKQCPVHQVCPFVADHALFRPKSATCGIFTKKCKLRRWFSYLFPCNASYM